jgi:hypothetical protein
MDHDIGNEVLDEVRKLYKYGYKSSDKLYMLSDRQKRRRKLLEKASRREATAFVANQLITAGVSGLRSGMAGNASEMSIQAARLVSKRGSTAQLGRVRWPGDHTFCVADYRPVAEHMSHNDTPKRLADMCFESWEGAWVIDAWMNVSCRFQDYPARAATKLAIWSNQGKRIFFEDRPYDPIEPAYLGKFNNGPLSFEEVPQEPTQDSSGEGEIQLAVAMSRPIYGPL